MTVGDKIHSRQAVEMLGIEKMFKQFDALPATLQRRVLRQAITAGGTAVARAIRKAAPKGETGNLKKAVKKKPSSKWRRSRALSALGVIGTAVGHDWNIGPHAHLVEHGHKAIYWGKASADRVPAVNYFFNAVRRVKGEVRSKITAKAKAALPKAIIKSLVPKKKK